MKILLASLHIVLIIAMSYRLWKMGPELKKFFWPALVIKLMSGICLGLIYTYYYSVADTFVYFKDAGKAASLVTSDLPAYLRFLLFDVYPDSLSLTFGEPRALFLTRITSVFNLLTGNNYWIIGLYFSLISFAGAWFLVRTIHRHLPAVTPAALAGFLFLPSALFWSSGLLKESVAMPCLYFLTAIFLKVWFDRKLSWREYAMVAITVWLCWNLKYYYIGVFIPVVATALLYKALLQKRFSSSPLLEGLVWGAMLLLPVLVVSYLHPNFYPHRLVDVILYNNAAYIQYSDPEDLVHFNDLTAVPLSLLWNSPWALFSGLFRPLAWETSALIQVLPGIENTVILLLFAGACIGVKRYRSSPHRVLVLAALAYVVILATLITFSTPNFGTLSRYKVGYFPFFVMIILCNNPLWTYAERSMRRLVSH